MTKQKTTTISISKDARQKIEQLKIHPRESAREVIDRVLKQYDKVKEEL